MRKETNKDANLKKWREGLLKHFSCNTTSAAQVKCRVQIKFLIGILIQQCKKYAHVC